MRMAVTLSPDRCKVTLGLAHNAGTPAAAAGAGEVFGAAATPVIETNDVDCGFSAGGTRGTNASDMAYVLFTSWRP